MKTQMLIALFGLAAACASNEQKEAAKAGEREATGATNQMTGRKPGAPPVATSPDALLSQSSVVKVQQALEDKGFSVEKTGVMDNTTKTALRSFQQREGIAATGVPDQMTLRKLDLDPQEILQTNPDRREPGT